MDSTTLHTTATYIRYILTLELMLGGQARLTSRLTPTVHKRAMAKAEGYRKYLSFIPIEHSKQHSQFIGFCMCTAASLLCVDGMRLGGASLSMSLSLMGVYAQYRMGVPFWLPVVNSVFAGMIIWGGR